MGGGADKSGVGDELRTIGKRQTRSFVVVVQPSSAGYGGVALCPSGWWKLVAGVGGQHAHDLPNGDQARAGRPHAADLHLLGSAEGAGMGKTQGIAFQRFVVLQILQAEKTRVGVVLLHLVDHGLGNLAVVKNVCPVLRDAVEDRRHRGVL